MSQGQLSAVEKEENVFPESEKKAMEKKIRELERLRGRKTMEVECLRVPQGSCAHRSRKKTDLARALARGGGFQMKLISDTLGISRSHLRLSLCKTVGVPRKPRGKAPAVPDADVLQLLRELVEARPSYGYRRACAVVNRKLSA